MDGKRDLKFTPTGYIEEARQISLAHFPRNSEKYQKIHICLVSLIGAEVNSMLPFLIREPIALEQA